MRSRERRLFRSTILATASVVVLCLSRPAVAQDDPPTIHKSGEEFLVPAPAGVGTEVLGRTFSRDLRPSSGAARTGSSKPKIQKVSVNRFASLWTDLTDEVSFGLSANYFALTASARLRSDTRFSTLTVYQVSRIERTAIAEAASGEFVATEVWYGWALSYLFQSASEHGELSASLKLLSKGADVQAALQQKQVSTQFIATGLERKSEEDVPVVLELADVMRYFKPAKVPEPIFVKYVAATDIESATLPGASRAAQEKILKSRFEEARKRRMQAFSDLDTSDWPDPQEAFSASARWLDATRAYASVSGKDGLDLIQLQEMLQRSVDSQATKDTTISSRGWQDVGFYVAPGEWVRVYAKGSWRFGLLDSDSGPEGVSAENEQGLVVTGRGSRRFQLVCRALANNGPGTYFLVGRSSAAVIPAGGKLECGPNWSLDGSSGEMKLRIVKVRKYSKNEQPPGWNDK
jgi:hypothetical protein